MNKLQKYTAKIIVHYRDVNNEAQIGFIDSTKKKEFLDTLENKKFLTFAETGKGTAVFRIYDFDLNGKINEKQLFINSLDSDKRKLLKQKEKEMFQKVGHGFTSLDHIKNILKK